MCGTGGMHGGGGHVWQGGVHGRGHMHSRGCAWHARTAPRQILRDMVNERAVGILLECILIYFSNVA